MSAHILLNLFTRRGKRITCEACRARMLDSISNDIKITLRSYFWRKKVCHYM